MTPISLLKNTKQRVFTFFRRKKANPLLQLILLETKFNSGFILLGAILVLAVVKVIIAIIFSLVLLSVTKADRNSRHISVLDIAEAGINYYLWHLAHDPTDYCDGSVCPGGVGPYGPYVHNFTDSSGKVIGTYTLWIAPPGLAEGGKVTLCHTPPDPDVTITVAPSAVQAHLDHGDTVGPCGGGINPGSNIVTVEARGDIDGGNENRSIVAELGIPSFANYAIVANDTTNHLRIGAGTEIFGPVHNNGGIHFDGVGHALVTSATTSYLDDDSDHNYPDGIVEEGVHTWNDPDDTFLAGRQFPVPPVNFSAVSTDLQNLRNLGQVPGEGVYYATSGSLGYHIVLRTNDTFDIYRVTGQGGNCGSSGSSRENITSQVPLVPLNRPFPSNSVIFIEDKLWLDGQINSAELTIVAARIGATPAQEKSVIINNDLEYTNYDGTDKLGVVAQKNVTVGYSSEGAFSGSADNQELRIDAAMIAQTGRIGRNYYNNPNPPYWWYTNCGASYTRNNITVYGSIATNQRYGFAFTDGTGYQNRNLLYDPYLTLSPPPYFPKTGSYTILSWKER